MLEIKHLTKAYGKTYAVDDISFKVNKGEILGFLGPNGAGKSTTMNMITGYLATTCGEVLIDGINILEDPMNAKKKIGYLPEKPPLYMDMTVREYLDFIYDLKKIKLCKKEHIQEICKRVSLENVYDKMIKNLSKGYCQRVGIAQALLGDPELIILDEPTVGLDPKQIVEVRDMISDIGKTKTVILSSHILTEIQAVCDRIIVISKGKIVADATTQQLASTLANTSDIFVSIGGGDKQAATNLLLALDGVDTVCLTKEKSHHEFEFNVKAKNGVDLRREMFFALAKDGFFITELHLATTLEDIFLSLTDNLPQISTKEKEGNV